MNFEFFGIANFTIFIKKLKIKYWKENSDKLVIELFDFKFDEQTVATFFSSFVKISILILEYVSNLMDIVAKIVIGKLISNSGLVCCIHFHENALEKGINSSFLLYSYGLNH